MIKKVKNYHTIMQAERRIDFYGGKNCDEEIAEWDTFCEGDMDGESIIDPLKLCPKTFPAGTRVIVQQPCCPDCNQIREICEDDTNCDFKWSEWDGRYA